MPRNITLAIDEDLLSDVRRYAAQHNTSVNALVRSCLEQLAERVRRQENEWDELFALTDQSGAEIDLPGNTRPTRDEAHNRP